jgi:ribosome biogenesis GTPase / thiamine phosphate phosphatase
MHHTDFTFDSLDIPRLRAIGLSPPLIGRLAAMPAEAPEGETPELLRVTEVQRESLRLHDGQCEHPARLRPALRQTLADANDAVAVGDWVLASTNALHERWVYARVPPLTQLARRLHDGRDKVTRVVIVSNVDTAVLVMGLDLDFSPRRLERYLALAKLAEVTPLVVLSKADLCAEAEARLRAVQAILPAGAAAVALNTLGDEPRVQLAPWLGAGQTLVLLGSSGAGKSTLTNALAYPAAVAGEPPRSVQLTGGNRTGDGRGRHTTTARSLHITPEGACIVDTPGLRTLRLDGDAQALGAAFDDIATLASQCRFRDCRHEDEPGCAVKAGVAGERLNSFHKLMREARRDTLTALERKAQVSQWKARGRAARVRMQAKRG